jgi:bla regulator protein blaR1
MIPTYLLPLANHLWQSSLFAAVAGLMALVLRKYQASLRYWLWLAASVKFLIPFSLLISLGTRLEWQAAPVMAPAAISSVVTGISQPFGLPAAAQLPSATPASSSQIPAVLLGIWLAGLAVGAFGWLRAWRRIRAAARGASPFRPDLLVVRKSVRVMVSPALVEPCVFGIFRPVLLLPEGIRDRLTPDQLRAILRHEICHVRRRDNLTAAIHLLVATLFWFYPLVLWIGKRLMDERENACDEEVLRILGKPEAYAEGILEVCRFGLESSPCAAGVTGSNLRRRIEAILKYRAALKLGPGRKLLLVLAATAALAAPLVTGVFCARPSRAQSQSTGADRPAFEVASIKSNRSGAANSGFRRFTGGELNATNITLKMLIAFAYDTPQDQILQGPGWLDSERYDVLAKPDRSSETGSQSPADRSMAMIRLRTQTLLADRFKLALHKETRQLPIFALVADRGGPKHLQAPKGSTPDLVTNGHHVSCQAASMEFFARTFLTGQVGRPVLDQTGIQGQFDFSMDWTPDETSPRRPGDNDAPGAPDPAGPSLFSALREQLGLKLEATKGPVEILVVDHAEKASEN